jgi:hypothetical protein
MATQKPLVIINGVIQQLPSGDTIGDSSSIQSVTLDFGTDPVYSKQFSFTASGVVTTQNVLISPSAKMPAGMALDELEMDQLHCAAFVSGADTITAIITAMPGPIIGQRNFNYQVS